VGVEVSLDMAGGVGFQMFLCWRCSQGGGERPLDSQGLDDHVCKFDVVQYFTLLISFDDFHCYFCQSLY